jgi:hypothetical protein
MEIKRSGDSGIIDLGERACSFHIESADASVTDFDFYNSSALRQWESDPVAVGPYRIVPFGETNNLPVMLRDIVEENNLAEGIFKRQRGLLWGQGPELYRTEFKENKREKVWIEDPEISAWLKSWDFEAYLQHIIVDYFHSECSFTKMYRNRGPRIGNPGFIPKLEYVSVSRARLEWPDDRLTPKRVIVGDFDDEIYNSLNAYPIYADQDPFKHTVSMVFSNMASFARRFYGVPAWYGSLNWIKRSSSIPKILKSLTDNSLNIKWHIISPASYWENKRDLLKEQCVFKGVDYNEKLLEDLKDQIFDKLAKVLSGEKNVGKFFTSEKIINELGNVEGWEIIPIDQKVKDYIEAQIKVADKADSATTSGLGLHPSLSNMMVDGKLASGSEQLYALKLYLATEIDIPEMIVCKAVNAAIAANWPGKKLKLGFYHDIVKTEDSVTSSERVKNVV